jgi:serpin B
MALGRLSLVACAVILVGFGCGKRAAETGKTTPLHQAAQRGDVGEVQALVAAGADVNAKDRRGRTALHVAALEGKQGVVQLLLAQGADVKAKDSGGCTPLHLAAWRSRRDVVELLVAGGANVNDTDNAGLTPVEYAARCGSFGVVELLVAKGAKLPAGAARDGSLSDNLVATVVAIAEPDVKTLIRDNSAFALDLYGRLRAAEGNLFLSPYSISSALAMTYAGARGETEKQMTEALHWSLGPEQLHPAFAGLQGWLNQLQKQGDVRLHIANSLWPQQGYKFLDDYLALTKKHYGVSITPVDYNRAPEAARRQINLWVEDKTERKIRDLIQPQVLSAGTTLVLVNAIYFKGKWADPFDPGRTKSARFEVSSKKAVVTPMMSQTINAGYAELEGLQVLSLPYRGDSLSMVVLLPKETDGVKQLEESLSIENLDLWRERLQRQRVHIFLPRFRMTSQFRLDETLQALGMRDAFKLPPADFSGMTGRRDPYISAAIHKAFVEVNEEGTEAAAATAIVHARARPAEPPTFRADHPFLFLIQENRTGSILFIGRLTDPTQARQ